MSNMVIQKCPLVTGIITILNGYMNLWCHLVEPYQLCAVEYNYQTINQKHNYHTLP